MCQIYMSIQQTYNVDTISFNPLKPNFFRQSLRAENVAHCYDWAINTYNFQLKKKKKLLKWFLELAKFFASGL